MNTQSISFQEYTISLETVMNQFEGEGSALYEDIVEELLEDASPLAAPAAFWRPLTVRLLSDTKVQLEDTVISGSGLAKRLRDVDQVYAFVCTIGDALWDNRTSTTDALEEFLYDGIMKTCLNDAFSRTAETIAGELPDKMGIYMNNPGSMKGWNLEGQRTLLNLLKEGDETGQTAGLQVNAEHVFENKFTMSGIIYAKGEQPANCRLCPSRNCSHRNNKFDRNLLAMQLYKSSIEPD